MGVVWMDVIIERCAGLDIAKDEVVACVRVPAGTGGCECSPTGGSEPSPTRPGRLPLEVNLDNSQADLGGY
jgi:hypothetical protein